jgi:Cdc6-like AAA superfamily ATPase
MSLIIQRKDYEVIKDILKRVGVIPEFAETMYGDIVLTLKSGDIVSSRLVVLNNISIENKSVDQNAMQASA